MKKAYCIDVGHNIEEIQKLFDRLLHSEDYPLLAGVRYHVVEGNELVVLFEDGRHLRLL